MPQYLHLLGDLKDLGLSTTSAVLQEGDVRAEEESEMVPGLAGEALGAATRVHAERGRSDGPDRARA